MFFQKSRLKRRQHIENPWPFWKLSLNIWKFYPLNDHLIHLIIQQSIRMIWQFDHLKYHLYLDKKWASNKLSHCFSLTTYHYFIIISNCNVHSISILNADSKQSMLYFLGFKKTLDRRCSSNWICIISNFV